MKRTIFIIAGSIALLLLFSAWIYLLIFGAPAPVNEAFTNLGFGQSTPIDEYSEPLVQTAELNLSSGSLVQLTTKPVAGFAFLDTASSTKKIRYAERGTGHIFEIDLESGIEVRVSSKTNLAVVDARFAPDGNAVALISEDQGDRSVKLLELGNRKRDHQIPTTATNIDFVSNTEVRYLLATSAGAVGFKYDLDQMTYDELFTSPFKDVAIRWGENETLLYNTPAPRLRGGLYKIEGGELTKIAGSSYAFSAVLPSVGSGVYATSFANLNQEGKIQTVIINSSSSAEVVLPIAALPEKCSFAYNLTTLWCAGDALDLPRDGQSNWYKGLTSFSDVLWKIDVTTGKTTSLDSLKESSGRDIDVIDLQADKYSTYLLFKNKSDDSLWLRKLDQ